MKLLRAADHRRMPWKNGGGETLEVAVCPADGLMAAFDWRVSMAVVAADGPFSTFPATDRTLVLLEGDGMRLAIAGREPVLLTPGSVPCTFCGDVATTATLIGGAIIDFNVMTARGRYTHAVERFITPRTLHATHSDIVLLLGTGATVDAGVALDAGDLLLFEPGEIVRARPAAGAACLLATIRPVG